MNAYCGIDRAENHHDIAVVDDGGTLLGHVSFIGGHNRGQIGQAWSIAPQPEVCGSGYLPAAELRAELNSAIVPDAVQAA